MPIGYGTIVTGKTREEDEENEEENLVIKARRKAIDDEAATGCSNARRFELELEFVQSLANPRYLHHLATTPNPSSGASSSKTDDEENDVLNSPEMVGYLSYLRYWYEDPEIRKVHFVPTLFVLLKAVARPILSPRDAKPETRGGGAHGTVSVLGERRDGESEDDTGVQRRGESAAGCLKCQMTTTTTRGKNSHRILYQYEYRIVRRRVPYSISTIAQKVSKGV